MVAVEERSLMGTSDVSTLYRWSWRTQEHSHHRGWGPPGSGCARERQLLQPGSGAGQPWVRSQLCPLQPV